MPRSDPRTAPGGPVHRALEDVLARCDVAARVASDPVEFVRAFDAPDDVEIVGLLASALAFGNVVALRAKIAEALRRIGPSPARAADDPIALSASLSSFRHRVWTGDDLARMLIGARKVQRRSGGLGVRFAAELEGRDLREALARFVDAIRAAGGLDRSPRRGARHLLPDPRATSSCKRLMLYLRWMIRGPDGADLGLWRPLVEPSHLLVPVDVHIHKLASNLGLTGRRGATWSTAVEITNALRRFDPQDPVRFDFALCHMGIVQRCPSRRDPRRCEGCGVRPVCRHWSPRRRTT